MDTILRSIITNPVIGKHLMPNSRFEKKKNLLDFSRFEDFQEIFLNFEI